LLNLAEKKPLGSIVKQDDNLRYRERQGYRPKSILRNQRSCELTGKNSSILFYVVW